MTLRARLGLRLVIWGFRLLGCPAKDIALSRHAYGLAISALVRCDWAEVAFRVRG